MKLIIISFILVTMFVNSELQNGTKGKNYVIVEEETIHATVMMVNKLITEGYRPVGGVGFYHRFFLQAMIKKTVILR